MNIKTLLLLWHHCLNTCSFSAFRDLLGNKNRYFNWNFGVINILEKNMRPVWALLLLLTSENIWALSKTKQRNKWKHRKQINCQKLTVCSQWHRKLVHINRQTLHPICSSVVMIGKCIIFLPKQFLFFKNVLLPQILQTTWDMMRRLLLAASNCALHNMPVNVKMTVTTIQIVEVTLVTCSKMKCKTLHKPWVSLEMSKRLHWEKELLSWFRSKGRMSNPAQFSPFQEFIFSIMGIVSVNQGTSRQFSYLVSTCWKWVRHILLIYGFLLFCDSFAIWAEKVHKCLFGVDQQLQYISFPWRSGGTGFGFSVTGMTNNIQQHMSTSWFHQKVVRKWIVFWELCWFFHLIKLKQAIQKIWQKLFKNDKTIKQYTNSLYLWIADCKIPQLQNEFCFSSQNIVFNFSLKCNKEQPS